jgi:hypothetical protein
MSYFFTMAIECGTALDDAVACKQHFEHTCVQNDGEVWEFQVQQHVLDDGGALVHWVVVWSSQLPASGVQDAASASILSLAGNALLAHLRTFKAFRFAILGVESLDAIQFSAFDTSLEVDPRFVQAFDGLVISNEILQKITPNAAFVPFSESHAWIPYLGECMTN